MSVRVQVTFDCADPDRLARFWCHAVGYELQDPPDDYDSWSDWLAEQGVPPERWNDASAIVDPEGRGPRFYFQRVPEGKTAKNRVHLDLNVGRDKLDSEAERLVGHGATVIRPPKVSELGEVCVVLRDPEGNEFCLQ